MRPHALLSIASSLVLTGSLAAQQAQIVLFADNLEAPVAVAFAPGDTTRVFVLGQFGEITIHDAATGVRRPQPFIDLQPLVCCFVNSNMVGLAFDPNYATNGYFYVHYQGIPTESVVARYQVTANPDIADPNSATVIIKTVRDGFAHIGGAIAFSPIDGYLYIPTGDSGNGFEADPDNRAQDPTSLYGKVLRVDPSIDDFPADPNKHYRIPPTNPFVGVAGVLPEIWALGLRNPFQSSFDRGTGEYYIADVGQNAREEINRQAPDSTGGLNYGWRCREGEICSGYGGCDCNLPALVGPIHTYTHAVGCSISGGRVYRGSALPSLQGWYLFSDYCTGFIHAVRRTGGSTEFQDLSASLVPSAPVGPFEAVTSIGDDASGELYITDIVGTAGGRVFKIVPLPVCVADLDDGTGTGTPDGGVTIDDLLYYITIFGQGLTNADLDDGSGTGTPDGGVTIDDLLYFLVRFSAGC
ncbi:MAG: PQQ-dependent sugar dehydrogenase [Phycisphaerales bacterium]|nr:MAG: PQQ-dependent sugar dehydrogenase [Phycisphaerales bacterium]